MVKKTTNEKVVRPKAIPKELPVIAFASAALFEKWLSKNLKSDGLWLKIAKKAAEIETVTYAEAVDIALCYGWIDGQVNRFDEKYYLQKFTPRRPRSLWSQINIKKVAALTKAGRMRPSGLLEVDAAKKDGRWDAAYASPKEMVFPEDLLKALEKNKKAMAYFKTLSKSNVYAIAFRLATAKKPETRERRFNVILEMLEKGEFR